MSEPGRIGLHALWAFSFMFVASGTHSTTATELVRRIHPLETTTGILKLSEVLETRLDVPKTCDDRGSGPMDCVESQTFPHIYRIEFELETRRSATAGDFVELLPRGTVFLALAMSPGEERSYAELLESTLSSLSSVQFSLPYAGLGATKPPFGDEISSRSESSSWVCVDSGATQSATHFFRTTEIDPNGHEVVVGRSTETFSGSVAKRLCSRFRKLTSAASPTEIRTISTPVIIEEESLVVQVVDRLPNEFFEDSWVPLPAGAHIHREKRPGVIRSHSRSTEDSVTLSSNTIDGIEFAARVLPASLPSHSATDNAWHARWRFRKDKQRLGTHPETTQLETWSITLSLLPIALDTENGSEFAIDAKRAIRPVFSHETLFEYVAARVSSGGALAPMRLAETIIDGFTEQSSHGWILVICMPDGSATWGLPPTTARPPLLNAQEFCTTVSSTLP